MIQSRSLKHSVPYIISILFTILFLYAAITKLLDYAQFKLQLQQSTILSGYASSIAWIVPLAEIGVAFTLLLDRFRLYALFASFVLVTLFTTYIVLILNFSDFIPCSCVGVMSALGWTGHIYLNIFLVALSVVGIFFNSGKQKYFFKNTT